MVVEREGRCVLVHVARVNCAQCGGCGLLARRGEHVMEFRARDGAGAEVGDEVLLRVPPHRLILSYLILFGLPLACMAGAFGLVALSFALAGGGDYQGAAVIAAVIAGLAGFWLGAFLAGRRGFSPEVLAVLGKAEGGGKSGGYRGEVL